jgi:hypothetical protein
LTVVWGAAYLAEAAARVVIVEMAPAGTALAVSKIMPYVVAALLIGWTNVYSQRARRRGQSLHARRQRADDSGISGTCTLKLNRKFLYRWP